MLALVVGPYRSPTAPGAIPRNCLFCGGDVIERGPGFVCSGCSLPAVPHEAFAGTPTCPRCSTPFDRRALEARPAGDATVHVCTACHGCFVRGPDWDALVVLERSAARRPVADPASMAPPTTTFKAVRCPACAREMERATFAATSPIVIDVCPPHGVWFDAGELAAALAFVPTPDAPTGIDRWVRRQEQLLSAEAPVIARALASAEESIRQQQASYDEVDTGQYGWLDALFTPRDR